MATVAVPTIHLNGTSHKRLLEALHDAREKLGMAVEALRATAPNARDYYPQDSGAFQRAAAEHATRERKIGQVGDEIDEIIEAIEDQVAARRRT